MNGPQDMGGHMGFGPIAPEANEPVFHHEWERRAFAITVAMGMTGSWNIDTSRHARERIPSKEYWDSSYYEIWFKGLLRLLKERGIDTPVKRVARADMIPAILAKGGPAIRPKDGKPSFAAGDKVRTRNINPTGHTRLPRYARGKLGEVALIHGAHVWPDSSAHGKGDDPQFLYTVRFTARELWGRDTDDAVMVDCWEPYLDPA
jgi:nitrile hydratase subunit beta